MTTKELLSNQISFKEKVETFPKTKEPKLTLKVPSFYCPQTLNLGSNFQEKKNCKDERFNSFCSYKSGLEFDMVGHAIFPGQSRYIPFSYFNFPMGIPSKINSRISNFEERNNNIKFEPNNFFLNCFLNEKEDILKEKKEEIKNNGKFNIKTNNNFNYLLNLANGKNNLKQNNWTPEKNINLNLNLNMNMETPSNSKSNGNNSGTKFFTNHNYGYKCSCSKTQCNRKYCECFNSGNYCIDCNCKNCNNKPPINSYTNKHPTDDSKNKKEKIICTCTKSGCNKNYCECFKNGQKCSALCRCISCENNDEITNKKNNMSNYECCPANSIYIVKNNIIIENIKNGKKIENEFDIFETPTMKENFIAICKKRKREETKNNEESFEKKKKKCKNADEMDLFNDSLFDKNGKVILRHINLIQI